MRSRRVLGATLGLIFASMPAITRDACASAFLQPVGEGDIITATEFSGSTRAFDQNGKLIPIPVYRKFELASYIEYGLFDRLTLIVQPFYETARQDDAAVSTPGTEIGARLGLARFGPTVISMQGLAHIPFHPGQAPQGGFDEDDILSGDLRLLVGHTFAVEGMPGFVDLQGGYRWQGDGAPNEWHADFTFGIRPLPRTLLLLQTFATVADGATRVCASYSGIR
ncbi:MAG: hypothetical protein WBD42_07250 [Methylovirgula sp.]